MAVAAVTADSIAESLRAEAGRLRERADQMVSLAALLEPEADKHQAEVVAEAPARSRQPRRRRPVEAPYGLKADGTPRKRRGRPPKPAPAPAPYGYKADGTPRKRPALSPEHQAKAHAAAAAKRNGGSERVDLRVISSTHPTPAELQDRELVHSSGAGTG
jgi:hypothetical protein